MPIRDIVSTVENPEQVRDKPLDSGNEYSYIVSKYLKVLDKKTLAEEGASAADRHAAAGPDDGTAGTDSPALSV